MNLLAKVIRVLSFRRDIRNLIFSIVLVEVVFFVAIFLFTSFIGLEELQQGISFLQSIQYQTIALVVVSVFQIIALGGLVGRWAYKNRFSAYSIDRLIDDGETGSVEFKLTSRWDTKGGMVNKEMEYNIARTIAGFLNTNGGLLLIGVADDKKVVGLELDYKTLKKQNRDGYLLHIASLIDVYLGKEFAKFISPRIFKVDDKDICRIEVSRSNKPAYVKYNTREEFFIRLSASTRPMTTREAHEYINMHWKKK